MVFYNSNNKHGVSNSFFITTIFLVEMTWPLIHNPVDTFSTVQGQDNKYITFLSYLFSYLFTPQGR